jgi:fructose-1,6-bisphosphatase II
MEKERMSRSVEISGRLFLCNFLGMSHNNLAQKTMKHSALIDLERLIELDLVRITEAAALQTYPWIGKGKKNEADAAASDAIRGMFEQMPIMGRVMIGEGLKDNAPGIFLGERLGSWKQGSLKLDIAIDPIDGTTNLSKGLPNAISVLAAAVPKGNQPALKHLPSFYSNKLAFGPRVVEAIRSRKIPHINLDAPIEKNLKLIAAALDKRVQDLMVVMLDRPRHEDIVKRIRRQGCTIRMISDGDVAGAIAPSLPSEKMDLYCGYGGSTEAVLAAAALRCLDGEILVKMWPRDEDERAALKKSGYGRDLERVFSAKDLAGGESVFFCATGINDSPLLPGLTRTATHAITSSIVMRAKHRTIRFISSHHNLKTKRIRLSDSKEHPL